MKSPISGEWASAFAMRARTLAGSGGWMRCRRADGRLASRAGLEPIHRHLTDCLSAPEMTAWTWRTVLGARPLRSKRR